MKKKTNQCTGTSESGIIDHLSNNNQDNEDLKLTPHQFAIVLIEMPRLSDKMRDALKRVVVDGESQKAVADSIGSIAQQHLSKNLTTFSEIYTAKMEANGFQVREVMIPDHLVSAVDDFEFFATRHLLEYQKIGKALRAKDEKDTDPENDELNDKN